VAITTIQTGFAAGEISPSMYGRVDLAKWRQGASTLRNMFVSYRGGAYSRPGTAYVGMCKQGAPNPGASVANTGPPRDIPFQFNLQQGYALEFGDSYMRIKFAGAYVIEATKAISGATQANPCVITDNANGYSNGDWIFITGMQGMTALNGQVFIVQNAAANGFTLTDLFGNVVNSTLFSAYTGGGTSARIYTVVAPYAAVDLPYLKYTQSADTMTLTCVNQVTLTEYPAFELVRNGNTNWTFTQDSFGSAISAPTGVTVTAESSTTINTFYSYVVTAVDAQTGEESVASLPGNVENNDISVNAGSNIIGWTTVPNAGSYNVYAATPTFSAGVPEGVAYGFIGTALGTQFTDTNITADFTTTPPIHTNPFARGTILAVSPTAGGSAYVQSTTTVTVNTSTGSGAVILPIVVGGAVVAYIVQNGGQTFAVTDTVTVHGAGTGATAALDVGPETGTYPGVATYFQQRRVYANSLNNPGTYFMSQPGAFANFDAAIPVTDSDSIIGTPWAQQVNGIQFMVPMPGGLVVLTGKGAWQLNGGQSAAITPSDQDAQPQAYNGCNAIMPPITINYDILYVQAKGSIVRDLSFNFFVNIYTGTDMTVLSNHLFTGHQLLQWAWAEEPYKLVWAVREDGILLCLTYLKEQDVYAWSRHDTNGSVVGVCSITEPPVDAVYLIVQRLINGVYVYYSERMDNRIWENVEDCWCVDAGLSLPQNTPNATLSAAAAEGSANLGQYLVIAGGQNYTNPVAVISDPSGAGATVSFTVVGGVITAVNPIVLGDNYTQPKISITDPTGTGAVVQPVITNNVPFTASAPVFTGAPGFGAVGDVIRMGGGKAVVTSLTSSTQVIANITQPVVATTPNDPNETPTPQETGDWTITAPVAAVTGLNHLEGMQVAILADGSVIPNQTVINNGILLQIPASQILVGLPFLPQAQTLYLEPAGQPTTVQSRRKNIYSVAARVEASRGFSVGTNQPDSSTQPNFATLPWTHMKEVKERAATVAAGAAIPLFTGDAFINVPADWDEKGQMAIQQSYPLPLQLLAVVAYFQTGDSPG
jgi:hypothetical protein